jgi:hypothetical protein
MSWKARFAIENNGKWPGSSFVLKHAATRSERITAQSSDIDLFSTPGFSWIA